jgi:hypothetical protein
MAHARLLQEGIGSGVFYLPITLWSASMVFGKIESSLDHVFRVDVPRHWALRKLLAFGMVLGLSVLLVGTLVLGGLLAAVDRYLDQSAILPLRGVPVYRMVNGFATRFLVPWLTAIGAFFLVYRIVPARAVPKGAALVAAVVAGSLWEILKLALTYYVASVAVFSRAYGALATLVILSGVGTPLGGGPSVGRGARGGGRGFSRGGWRSTSRLTQAQDYLALARHPERLPSEALDDQGIGPEGVNLRREGGVLRFEAAHFLEQPMIVLPRLHETEDSALSEERVENGRRHDEKGREHQSLPPEGGVDKTAAPRRGLRPRAIVLGRDLHLCQAPSV